MPVEYMPLGSFVDIMTGAPLSRAKKLAEGDELVKAKVLIPAAMAAGRIDDSLIATETVSKVKEDLFTKKGDIVVKASTPYDCSFIDEDHEGLLVTSFGFILRSNSQSLVDMRYLATFLGLDQTNKALQEMSKGMTIRLIKKRDIGDLMVPIPSAEEQARLAAIFIETQKHKEVCRAIVEKSELLLQSEFARLVIDSD
ncbi:hypothetical protein AAK684_08020 [Leptogranulimonas caecicola]|uniref:Type I restriction modification DNA specificity protein n=1 Tax=Leptogranulimonas caecicola TaxID=2894156 RepID=A0AAU9C2V5_9ACTN|nr:hypothetical protein [Leptogranulimonas caecicola]BCV18066.1 hypothetical protein ATOBIA_N03560 [Atopobiaceae bacterium P1]BDC90473.1 hypothetical protein ATTO_03450 [Leptogranulimonas caecicola]